MDIQPHSAHKAAVRFDSFEERREFGAAVPALISVEYHRWVNSMMRGSYTLNIMEPYSKLPDEYPEETVFRHRLLGRVLAKSSERGREESSTIVQAISDYFIRLSEQ